MVFFKGAMPDSMYLWPWGFAEDPVVTPGLGYTPGTSALKWATSAEDGWQGAFIGLNSNDGNDMSSIWSTDSLYFKMKAPNGLAADDSMTVWFYDSNNSDWEYAVWVQIDNLADLNDGYWHQFAIALADFQAYNNPIDQTDIVAVSFEAENPGSWGVDNGISAEIHIDDVWIGQPQIHLTMTLFNGLALSPGVYGEVWGFADNTFVIAEGEGFTPGTNAIVWENNTASGPWDSGIGMGFDNQDFTDSWAGDTLKIKIKAPAGINNLALLWWDYNWNTATKVLSDVTWDGNWQELEIPLIDFVVDAGFDTTGIYYLSIAPESTPIPERILITEIWTGNPSIDLVAPSVPENINAGVANLYYNEIGWTNIDTESGETYDVYASMSPIDDIAAAGVLPVASGVAEGEVAVHNIYYPLADGEIAYYYAVTCTDASGNVSDGFGTGGPFSNTGKARAIISLDAPAGFTADADLGEWQNIVPFNMRPETNLWKNDGEELTDSSDLDVSCYVAMDDTNLYVAFYVVDDNFTWSATNTVDWWVDESIEFYFGLYELGVPHSWWQTGAEPDYRLVFTPTTILWGNGWDMTPSTDDYIFYPVPSLGYIIESRIPFSSIYDTDDSTFTPIEGMTIPFEIYVADADVANSGNVSRLQLGNNAALNPWGMGPEVWTFAWIGMPDFTVAVDDNRAGVPSSFVLSDNYPNPFNPVTTINYQLPEASDVKLTVFNILGEQVATIVNNNQPAGYYTAQLDAGNLASGVYFYQIRAGKFSQTKKMLLVK